MRKKLLIIAIFAVALYISNVEDASKRRALIVVDVQNCFTTGTLAVKDSESIIPVINKIRKDHGELFNVVVLLDMAIYLIFTKNV